MDTWFRIGSCRKTKLSNDEGTSSSGTTSSEIVDVSNLDYMPPMPSLMNKGTNHGILLGNLNAGCGMPVENKITILSTDFCIH
ncbi:Hypothetical protein CINCED_3A001845 [Cinara cedri]|uniref:Uncharacterized protein n=1 Tax=Cinara cedri TaxID=506608 RepID=A0A5E4M0G1_9HEMI|nr:Hypothetical protein CINCED_3A001845 [Cinara cedri]